MADYLLAALFTLMGVSLVIISLSPPHVTRADNPIIANVCMGGGAVICFVIAGAFVIGG